MLERTENKGVGRGCGRRSASRAPTACLPLGLTRQRRKTCSFRFDCPLQSPQNLGSHREHMPDLLLMAPLFPHLADGIQHGSSAITDRTRRIASLLLQHPQHQSPTVSIHSPGLPAMHINHIQIRFSALTALWFVQGQGARRRRLLLVQPVLGTLSNFLDHACNHPQAHIDPMQASLAGLDASIPGVRFDHHGQNQRGNRRACLHRQDLLSQRLLQG